MEDVGLEVMAGLNTEKPHRDQALYLVETFESTAIHAMAIMYS